MLRVNRSVVLSLLIISSSVFLLFQLHYYRKYVSKAGPHILSRTGHLTASDVQWQTVKKFLGLAQRFRLPLFLADTAALTLLSHDALRQRDRLVREPHCSFLCTGRPVTSFALHANLWKYEPAFLLAVEEKGFEKLELRGEDPRLASLDTLSGEEIPLHFLFRLHGYIIQVVFLYERSGNYLWHGALRLKANVDRSFAPFKLLDYGRHAGAYDRPELLLTVLDGLDVRIPRNVSRFLSEQQHARYLECHYRDARNFLQLYPDDSSPEAVDFRRKVKKLLHLAARQKVSSEVRKYRTMTELIVDATEFVKNPYKGKKLKTHPDFPKKPLTPYFRFFMEKRAKYAKIHPEMSNLDLTKILSKKYKELLDKKKQKYITEFQREKEEFEKNMARFKEDHPELIEERKKSDLPEKPKTPQQLWYNHEKKTYMKLHPEVSQKELKEALRRQWSQLSDKRRLKWISKALELQKDYEGSMRAYHEAHPDVTSDDHVRSVLTKAERQLKDKFDGRPTKPPPNGYSLYCAELMVNMKDVPSTERMVLCSKQWKVMTQKEKDMFQKRCEQRKKQYDVDLQRFLESLPDEERDRVMGEEKLGGSRLTASPHRAKSPSVKCREAEPETWTATGQPKERRDGKKAAKLPETPKTAEEMWQHSVIGDYLAKYRSDRRKAQAAMEAAWKSMEKKEKIPWIKKAAEDQKRYERELLEMRAPPTAQNQRKPKFDGEPKKPPVSGYQMFSQELLTNGELNHFSLKERMVEIGKRWHKLSQTQKDKYKKMVEEQQGEYKAELEDWVKSLSPQDRAVYQEFSTSKRRSTTKVRNSPGAKVRVTAKGKAAGSRAATPTVGVAKRAMAYRAKQDVSDSDEEKSDSSDSDEDDETSGSSDSDDDDDENEDEDDEDDEDQSSSEESSDSDSD